MDQNKKGKQGWRMRKFDWRLSLSDHSLYPRVGWEILLSKCHGTPFLIS